MEVQRLFDIFPYQLEKYPKGDAIAGKFGNVWETFSTQQVIDITDGIALGLLKMGFKKGDFIGLISDNSVEWTFADFGIQKMGGIVVPLYPTSSIEDVEYITAHAEIKAVFVGNEELCVKVKAAQSKLPSAPRIITFEEVPGYTHYKQIMVPVSNEGRKELKAIQDTIGAHGMATVIYTSGTTGLPKGVMLTHNNVISNILASIERVPVDSRHTALSFLPLSHIYERMITYMYFFLGISVYYAESLEKIGDNLKEIRPHVFTAVPRLLEKVFDKILAGGNEKTGVTHKIFNWAVNTALKWEPVGKGPGYKLKLKLADKLVFSKIRAKAGLDRILAVASGSAKLQERLARFYNAIGVPTLEGYGLTETSPVISVNSLGKGGMKIGTVGKVISGGEVKIYPDGEICYKGPNVMMGYFKDEAKTKEVIDDKGFLHTGDIGLVDKQGFLKITDRKKDMWKTSGGKYVAPGVIEDKLKQSYFIEQAVVVGEGRRFPGALIVPNFEHLYNWLKEEGINFNEDMPAAVVSMDKVKAKIQSEVDRVNESRGKWEMIKRFELLSHELTIAGGELSPSMKIKRKIVREKYAKEIDQLYNS